MTRILTITENKLDDGKIESPLLKSLAIKINNFALWGASGCVTPYLSIYFTHYTAATSSHIGITMLMASIIGMFVNLTLSSISDRYRAHRLVYLCVLSSALVVYSILLIPIYLRPIQESDTQEQEFLLETTDAIGSQILMASDLSSSTPADADHITVNQISVPTLESVFWFYIVAISLATGSMLTDVATNFGESFSASIAARCHQSYGSVKFWGALGWCSFSLFLYIMSKIRMKLPYLASEFSLFTILIGANIVLVLLWPDKRPFNLSDENELQATIKGSSNDLTKTQQVVELRHLTLWLRFDQTISDQELANGKVPYCNNFMKAQNQLDRKQLPSQQLESKKSNLRFKFVTKIEAPSNTTRQTVLNLVDSNYRVCHQLDIQSKLELGSHKGDSQLHKFEDKQVTSFRDYLWIIKMIIQHDKNMLRFMFIYAIIGFNIAQNWYYLFPYLKTLDKNKFTHLASFVMISGQLSETVFYSISSYITRRCSHSRGLNVILFLFTLRYSFYLAINYYPDTFPMESIVLVELLQAPTMGWFNCIFSQAPIEFSRNFRRWQDSLDDRDEMKQQKIDINLTLLGVSSCCFDGIGVAFGSLIGGWLIDQQGFQFLWLFNVSLSLTICCLDLALEFGLASSFSRDNKAQTKIANENGVG